MIGFIAIAYILTPAGYNRNIRQNQEIDPRKTNLLKISIKKKVKNVGVNLLEGATVYYNATK